MNIFADDSFVFTYYYCIKPAARSVDKSVKANWRSKTKCEEEILMQLNKESDRLSKLTFYRWQLWLV